MHEMAELERDCCIRGYHIYESVWHAAVGESLSCVREPTNEHDLYAVAVMKSGQVIGHLPRKVNRVCSIFLRRGGSISCIVLGGRRYSADLPQGGLEIPCRLLFEGEVKEIEKIAKHFKVKCTDIDIKT